MMDNYSMIQAAANDFETVRQIAQETIRAVYPAYYPAGAVDFFCRHHSDESISADIRLFAELAMSHRSQLLECSHPCFVLGHQEPSPTASALSFRIVRTA